MKTQLRLIKKIILNALQEDMGKGDVTTDLLITSDSSFYKAKIVANSQGVLAGIEIVKEIFHLLCSQTIFIKQLRDGDNFNEKDTLLELKTSPSVILKGERVALNFLQKLSGIATLTRKFVNLVTPYGVKILDTRKTTPNLRLLEKYAVKIGGGFNHRFDLSSLIIIKDNHIKVVGSIKKAIKLAKQNTSPFTKIEVEVASLDELKQITNLGIDVVMLDNFDCNTIKKAVEIIKKSSPELLIEVSGGVTLDNVESIAKEKPDFISIGKITNSPVNLDMSLKIL